MPIDIAYCLSSKVKFTFQNNLTNTFYSIHKFQNEI